jgi:L-cysteine S-thiosulfotransferase
VISDRCLFRCAPTSSRGKPSSQATLFLALTLGTAFAFAGLASAPGPASAAADYRVVGDAIPASLTDARGDPARGRAIVVDRHTGLCLLCHSGPLPEERFQGTIAPDLKGSGARWSEGQLRLRMVDPGRLTPGTIMPAYYRTEGLTRVAPAYQGKTVLSAEQIEDVVAFLATLRE